MQYLHQNLSSGNAKGVELELHSGGNDRLIVHIDHDEESLDREDLRHGKQSAEHVEDQLHGLDRFTRGAIAHHCRAVFGGGVFYVPENIIAIIIRRIIIKRNIINAIIIDGIVIKHNYY